MDGAVSLALAWLEENFLSYICSTLEDGAPGPDLDTGLTRFCHPDPVKECSKTMRTPGRHVLFDPLSVCVCVCQCLSTLRFERRERQRKKELD